MSIERLQTHKIIGDEHGLLTLLDDENSPQHNLYNQIDKCYNMYLNMDKNQRRDIDKFTAIRDAMNKRLKEWIKKIQKEKRKMRQI